MATGIVTPPRLLTAEEFGELPDNGVRMELVRGVPVPMNMPFPRHGEVCVNVSYLLRRFLEDHPIGRAIGNDSGVVTERGPDTVRGADVAFYSFQRVPPGPLPRRGYLAVMPEVVFEVRSVSDRWSQIQAKVAEYLTAGVDTVVVLDEQTQRAWVYRDTDDPVELGPDQELVLPAPLDGWRVPVRRFFE
jgi:Uma2 family endonuclease